MAISFLHNIDLNQNELQNVKFQILAVDPIAPVEAQMWYNSQTKSLKYFNGATTVNITKSLDIHSLSALESLSSSDELPIYDVSASKNKKVLWQTIVSALAAYYDTVGAASAVLGKNTDASTANTVYGSKALANEKISSIMPSNNGVVIAGTNTNPTIGLQLSTKAGNSLTIETTAGKEGLYAVASSGDTYSMLKADTAEAGYFSTYNLTKNGTAVGASINIPKDYLVKSAELKTVTTVNTPYSAAQVGDKYIDFTVNTYDSTSGSGIESHLYLPVNDLIDVYTAGDGIDISGSNTISLDIDANNANGIYLSGSVSGAKELALALASAGSSVANSTPGAISAAQIYKLSNMSVGANKTEVSTTNGNIKIDSAESVVYTLPDTVPHKYISTNPSLTPSSGVCTWTVSHNLGTRNAIVDISLAGSPYTQIMAEIVKTSANSIKINILSSDTIASGTYTVTVIG